MNTHFRNWCRAHMNQRNRALIGVEALGLMAIIALFLYTGPLLFQFVQVNLNRSLPSVTNQNNLTLHVGSKLIDNRPEPLNMGKGWTPPPEAQTRPGFYQSCGVELPIGGPHTPWTQHFSISSEPITNEDVISKGDWITVFTSTDSGLIKTEFVATVLTLPKANAKTKVGTVLIFESLNPSDTEAAKLKGQIVNVIFS
jgi:hypothetical protein